jgi:AAA+ ATPase superfamily predicted ATPase
MKFIGREQELSFLEERYAAPGGQLLVMYGRRRVGKTETLRKFCKDKPHVFYSCRESSDGEQLKAYSARVLKAGIPAARYIQVFGDWEAAFRSITELPGGSAKQLLVIDEFPYMCKGNNSIPSILQNLWDETLKNENVMLVLCGSAMSFIEKELLAEKSPLYGRATGIYKMKPLPYPDAMRFFGKAGDVDKVFSYAAVGGIPHYLGQMNPAYSAADNVIHNVLKKGCPLYSEVEFLIRQELREPALYNTIIEAIALGNTQLNDIYTKTRIEKTKINVYLKNLIELGIIEREFSVLASKKEQAASTRGIYRLTDNFFRFWYRFVFTNLSDLEAGDHEGVNRYAVEPQLNDFCSPVFEYICRDYLRLQNKKGALPFRAQKIGRWWGRTLDGTETEIDVLAVDSVASNYIFAECKFRDAPFDVGEYNKLKAKQLPLKSNAKVYYSLFSKSGFTQGLRDEAARDPMLVLVDLADVLAD